MSGFRDHKLIISVRCPNCRGTCVGDDQRDCLVCGGRGEVSRDVPVVTAFDYDLRVTELLEANNAEVARRRKAEQALAALSAKIGSNLNDHLIEMKPDYDDSITGFNEAWDIVRKVLAEAAA